MIFIVTESLMNGTVAMSTTTVGIEAKSFANAVRFLKRRLAKLPVKAVVHKDDQWAFRYSIQSEFPLYGSLESKPLTMLK